MKRTILIFLIVVTSIFSDAVDETTVNMSASIGVQNNGQVILSTNNIDFGQLQGLTAQISREFDVTVNASNFVQAITIKFPTDAKLINTTPVEGKRNEIGVHINTSPNPWGMGENGDYIGLGGNKSVTKKYYATIGYNNDNANEIMNIQSGNFGNGRYTGSFTVRIEYGIW